MGTFTKIGFGLVAASRKSTAQPFIAVRSSISKNHKQAQQPLPKFVVDSLRKMRPAAARPNELVFANGIPRVNVYREDLAAAGIDYLDAQGRVADFHALRTTFGTLLTLASRSQRTVMELMRHSDMKLTTKTYTDASMLPLSDTIELLPDFSAQCAPSQIASQNCRLSESYRVHGGPAKCR